MSLRQTLFLPLVHAAPRRIRGLSSRYVSSLVLNTVSDSDSTLLEPSGSTSSSPARPALSARDFLKQRNYNDLKQALSGNGSPSHIWASYTSLMNVIGHDKLPLEIHQQVLRRCTPPNTELRVATARRLQEGIRSASTHIHEWRFQTVIRNIRADDALPTLDDYHFILEQFAAVGYHVGAMSVYKELTHLGWKPRTKTFGLCLQAIAHRLAIPSSKVSKQRRVAQTRAMLSDLMKDMQKLSIPFTSVNLDLTMRILKETLDMPSFDTFMKWGYGIDLANPDRPPLDYLGIKSDLSVTSHVELLELPQPQPFSVAALNTTLEFIGRTNNVSKLIQAFEVLTQPLPRASQYQFSFFDDEDDFGVSGGETLPASTPPHARPNTTSYNILIRHLCRLGQSTLARHYLNEVRHLDAQATMDLHWACKVLTPSQIASPCVSINRGTFLPVFGHSNRDGDVALMRWLLEKIPKVIRRKRRSLRMCREIRSRWSRERRQKLGGDPALANTDVPSPSEPPQHSSLAPISGPSKVSHTTFDVDFNSSQVERPSAGRFDIDLHISILERDIEELEGFHERAQDAYGRHAQRLKERLGRRVWAAKDIYVDTDNRRVLVGRERWRDMVNFRARRGFDPSAMLSSLENSSPPSTRSFSTTYFSNNEVIASSVATGEQASIVTVPSILARFSSKFHNNET